MRWRGARQSINVEDRRMGGRRLALGGGVGSVVLVLLAILFGADPMALLQEMGPSTEFEDGGVPYPGTTAQAEEEHVQFVSTVLADTEDAWNAIFTQMGKSYVEPKLVLFRRDVQSACGFADAAIGPFYCPGDSKVYLDLGFFDELERRFEAPGDFAQAYVIAHEIGHHVQTLLGITDRVRGRRGALSEREFNELSVRLELQADFFAGVWAHHANRSRSILEEGDIEEGIRAAAAVGDDNIQRRMRGYVVPDSFTHGTSAQRVRWFRKGLETGDVSQGDTFTARDP